MSKSDRLNDKNDDYRKKIFEDLKRFYGMPIKDFNESPKIDSSNKIFDDAIKIFDDLIEEVNSKQKISDFELDYKNNRFFSKKIELYKKERRKELPYLESKSLDIIEQIKKEYQETKKEIVLDDIMPLMNNIDFIDLIVEKKIPFKSLLNNRFSESLSRTLLYLSNKKGLGKGGNPYVGETAAKQADTFALKMGRILDELEKLGFSSLKKKADELNSRNIKTHRGKDWTKTAVSRIVNRWKIIKAEDENKKPSTPKPE